MRDAAGATVIRIAITNQPLVADPVAGLMTDGSGILLDNERDGFAAKPGAPNADGLVARDRRGKRPPRPRS